MPSVLEGLPWEQHFSSNASCRDKLQPPNMAMSRGMILQKPFACTDKPLNWLNARFVIETRCVLAAASKREASKTTVANPKPASMISSVLRKG